MSKVRNVGPKACLVPISLLGVLVFVVWVMSQGV